MFESNFNASGFSSRDSGLGFWVECQRGDRDDVLEHTAKK